MGKWTNADRERVDTEILRRKQANDEFKERVRQFDHAAELAHGSEVSNIFSDNRSAELGLCEKCGGIIATATGYLGEWKHVPEWYESKHDRWEIA